MALNIQGANIGYDQNEVQAALNNLNTVCILETVNILTTSMAELRTAVDQVWVGQSAETFKSNMEFDKDNIIKGLNATQKVLETRFTKIVNDLAEVDNSLIAKRGA